MDYSWSDYKGNWNLSCKENHYYDNGIQWIVNGDPKLNKCDIWYYKDRNYSECIGCPKIPQLQCWEECIYSDFDNVTCSFCETVFGTSYGDEYCPPSLSPSRSPSWSPSVPSRSPSESPSWSPSTSSPTSAPTKNPSKSPSLTPTSEPTTLIKDLTNEPNVTSILVSTLASTDHNNTSYISSTKELGKECLGLDLAITLFYFFEYDRIQKKCDICLYQERGQRAQRTCERIADFVGGIVDDYSKCMLNICGYECAIDQLQLSPKFIDSDESCGCNVLECGPQAASANKYHALTMIFVFSLIDFVWM